MIIGLTTRWNAGMHTEGERMIEEILALGFDHVELGYDLRLDLVPGVLRMVQQKAVRVVSVHNFCPVPVVVLKGHPELFSLSARDPRERERAIHHTTRTIRFAAEVGAGVVVAHAGNVEMTKRSGELLALCAEGRLFTPAYERTKLKLQMAREKKAKRHLDGLRESVTALLPVLAETGVQLAFENLPTWEAVPTEMEMEALCREMNTPHLRYWHDIGHGQIRQLLGFINQERWLERLAPWLVGLHIHDVRPPALDHAMPPGGMVDFKLFRRLAKTDILRILEPGPGAPAEKITEAADWLRRIWEAPDEPT
jgi:sugar phosphate isomerase/epimerase